MRAAILSVDNKCSGEIKNFTEDGRDERETSPQFIGGGNFTAAWPIQHEI